MMADCLDLIATVTVRSDLVTYLYIFILTMDRTKDIFNSVMESWRRRSLGLSQVFSKLNLNPWFEGVDVVVGNPTEFKQNLNVTVDENGALIGSVISTFVARICKMIQFFTEK